MNGWTQPRLESSARRYTLALVIAALLRCLCDPKSKGIHSQAAHEFVQEHNRHVSHAFTMAPFPEDKKYEPESVKYCRTINGKEKDVSFLGFFAGTRSYQDIADPILEFLLAEHDKFLNKEYKEPIPVIVCSNPGCDKLVMPDRIGKRKFCSEDCKAANHKRNIPQKERTDYQWLYRLREKPAGLKRKALRSERFRLIKAEKGYGPACRELVRKLERFT